ncbi:hypothetical protein BHE74_00017661 [Ensete ventricosum]|nr:hypothetical protein BHE74_00017661 [Ensete ventricosum]
MPQSLPASSLLPATAAFASPSPPTTASYRCCPLPRSPLPPPATFVPILPHLSLAIACCRNHFQSVFFITACHCSICLPIATHHRFTSSLPSTLITSSSPDHLCSYPPCHCHWPSLPSPFLLSLPAPSHVDAPLLHLPSATSPCHLLRLLLPSFSPKKLQS